MKRLPWKAIEIIRDTIGVDLSHPFNNYCADGCRVIPFQKSSPQDAELVKKATDQLKDAGFVATEDDHPMIELKIVENIRIVNSMAGVGRHTGPLMFLRLKKFK